MPDNSETLESVVIRDTFAAMVKLPTDFLQGKRPLVVPPQSAYLTDGTIEDKVLFQAKVDGNDPPRCHCITGTFRGTTRTVHGIPRGQG